MRGDAEVRLSPRMLTCCWTVTLATLVVSCASPAHRDFAATRERSASPAVAAVPAPLVVTDLDHVDLGPWLEQWRQRHGIPGAVAAVLRGERVLAQGAAGVRRRTSPALVTVGDSFHIASCAKAFSAFLVARLVEEGTLNWDTSIRDYLPAEVVHPAWEAVTVRHLMTHTAGARDSVWAYLATIYFTDGDLPQQRAALARRVLRSPPAGAIGEMAYSNASYILLAAVAESAAGRPWEQMMHEEVLAPLRLDTAGYGPPGTPGQVDQPWGHGKRRLLQLGVYGNVPFDPGARSADYPALASPAGYLHLSLSDWARFVALQLRSHAENPHSEPAVVAADTWQSLHDARAEHGYAGGWFVGTRPWARGTGGNADGTVLYHVGDNGRWTSAAWLAPELDFAVLLVCNRGDQNAAVDEAVAYLVRSYARSR